MAFLKSECVGRILVRAALEALDLDADWDSDAHDQQMAAVLAEIDGVGTGGNDDKPTWDDEIDIDDIIPPIARPVQDESSHASAVKERRKAKKKERKKRLREDEASAVDVNEMDADAPSHGGPELDEVEWDGTDEMRKRVLDQYMDEVFGLEFNDMVRPLLLSPAFPHVLLMHTTHIHLGCRDAHALPLRPCSAGLIWAERLRNSACGRQGPERVRRVEEARAVSQAAQHMGYEAW